ncbi:MAG: hypothetical protein WCO56_29705, partial [Verrucomicrobiota bacterium]
LPAQPRASKNDQGFFSRISSYGLTLLFCVFVVTGLILLSGCITDKQIAVSDKHLFECVKIGMSRADAEKILGNSVLEVGDEYHYGKQPKIKGWDSPESPTSIIIIYSSENIVQSKKFFGDN